MEALLKKQNELLSSLDKIAKRDELIQIAQLYENKQIDNDGDRVEEQLKDLNVNVEKLNAKTGDNLNSNVIKLTDALREKFRGSGKGIQSENILPTSPIKELDTLTQQKPAYIELQNIKDDLKDLFSLRGFLDKMGIAKRGETGLISEFMDRKENSKLSTKSIVNITPENQSNQLERFTGSTASSLSGEEDLLEQNRMIAQQTGLLTKIEENTSVLKSMGLGAATVAPVAAAGAGPGLIDAIPGKKILGGLKSSGKALVRGASSVGKFAMRNAGRLGAVGAVGAGLYEGYSGFTAAGDKQEAALAEIDTKVKSGEISPEQAEGLKQKVAETATVEKSGSVGKGSGTAVGGAVGALKGAAVGAAIGSVVPVVGTLIGGAIGATVGAVGGSYLGSKAGEYLGEKVGQATNFVKGFFGGDGARVEKAPLESSKVDIQFSEMKFAQKDRESYKKFKEYRKERIEHHLEERSKKRGGKKTAQSERMDKTFAEGQARTDAIIKFRNEIEAVGSGKVTGGPESSKVPGEKTAEALQKVAEGVTGKPTEASRVAPAEVTSGLDSTVKSMNTGSSIGNGVSQQLKVTPPVTPSSGDRISQQSSEVDSARMAANKPSGGNTAVVNAPTVNNTSKVSQTFRSPPRTQENSVTRYLDKRYA